MHRLDTHALSQTLGAKSKSLTGCDSYECVQTPNPLALAIHVDLTHLRRTGRTPWKGTRHTTIESWTDPVMEFEIGYHNQPACLWVVLYHLAGILKPDLCFPLSGI